MYNEGSGLLLKKPTVRLVLADGKERPAKIVAARRANKVILIELAGLVDRNEAELLRGAKFFVPRDQLAPLDDDEFYAADLEGAKVFLAGEEIGRVKLVQEYPTCDVIVVEREGKPAIEVPLVDAYVGSVDAAAGRVELVSIEGLV
jgi:16S rRNA processing protein RimM